MPKAVKPEKPLCLFPGCPVHPRNGTYCSKHRSSTSEYVSKEQEKEIKENVEIRRAMSPPPSTNQVQIECRDTKDDRLILCRNGEKTVWLHTSVFDEIIERYLYKHDHETRIEMLTKYASEEGCPCKRR